MKKEQKKLELGDDQKIFIQAKVKELGDVEAVKKFYNRPDLVSKFALEYAEIIFKQKNKKKIKIKNKKRSKI